MWPRVSHLQGEVHPFSHSGCGPHSCPESVAPANCSSPRGGWPHNTAPPIPDSCEYQTVSCSAGDGWRPIREATQFLCRLWTFTPPAEASRCITHRMNVSVPAFTHCSRRCPGSRCYSQKWNRLMFLPSWSWHLVRVSCNKIKKSTIPYATVNRYGEKIMQYLGGWAVLGWGFVLKMFLMLWELESGSAWKDHLSQGRPIPRVGRGFQSRFHIPSTSFIRLSHFRMLSTCPNHLLASYQTTRDHFYSQNCYNYSDQPTLNLLSLPHLFLAAETTRKTFAHSCPLFSLAPDWPWHFRGGPALAVISWSVGLIVPGRQ